MALIGTPSEDNWYLFNGDYVDRGSHGVEVVLILLAFKLVYPESVWMNRGNHECRGRGSSYLKLVCNIRSSLFIFLRGDSDELYSRSALVCQSSLMCFALYTIHSPSALDDD